MDKYEYEGRTVVSIGDLVELEALHRVEDIRHCPRNADTIEVLIGDPSGDHGGKWLPLEECRVHRADGTSTPDAIPAGEVEAKILFDGEPAVYLYGERSAVVALVIPLYIAAMADSECSFGVDIDDEKGPIGAEQMLEELDGMPLPPGMADRVLEQAAELRKLLGQKDRPKG